MFFRLFVLGTEAARPPFVVSYGPQQIMRRIHTETVAGRANADAVRARAARARVRPNGEAFEVGGSGHGKLRTT
jgi:hypothetical protein